MIKIKYYISFAVLSLILLLGYILLSPESQKEGESLLWKKQFKQIVIERPNEAVKTITFERRGLFAHSHYVTYNGETRPGGTPVQNIFRNWSEPVLKGIYTEAQMNKTFETAPEGYVLKLFEAPGAIPYTIEFGPKTASSDRFIKVTGLESAPVYFVIQDSLFSGLNGDPLRFRERRTLIFPTGTYIDKVQAVYSRDLEKGKSIERLQMESFQKEKTPVRQWKTSGGIIIDQELSDSMDHALKQISISLFRDEAGISKEAIAKAFQDSANDLLTADISISRPGEQISVRFREIPDNIKIDKKEKYLLMQNQTSGEIDFVHRLTAESIIIQAEKIRNFKISPEKAKE
jgi:hypothetical protein